MTLHDIWEWGHALTDACFLHTTFSPLIFVPQRSLLPHRSKHKQAVMELGRHFHSFISFPPLFLSRSSPSFPPPSCLSSSLFLPFSSPECARLTPQERVTAHCFNSVETNTKTVLIWDGEKARVELWQRSILHMKAPCPTFPSSTPPPCVSHLFICLRSITPGVVMLCCVFCRDAFSSNWEVWRVCKFTHCQNASLVISCPAAGLNKGWSILAIRWGLGDCSLCFHQ